MRVVMLGLYPSDPQRVLGGVEAVTYLLTRALVEAGVEVHMVTLKPRGETVRPPDGGPTALHVLPLPRFSRLTWHTRSMARLLQAVRALRPDLVHAHGSDMYTGAAVRSPYPHVVTVHGVMAREAPTVWGLRRRLAREVDRWFERWTLARAREIIAISPYVRDAYPWLRARLHFVENPVNPRYFHVPTDRVVPGRVLCVARVIPRKDILGLIRAFRPVVDRVPHAELFIAGETLSFPEYAQACREEVERLRLGDRVHFLGGVDEDTLADAYARAHVVVLNSVQETAPVVIAEALAAATPVVATRVGGVPYMVEEGRTGRLVPPRDPETLARVLTQVLSDPGWAARAGQEAREVARSRFHPRRVAERHLDVYRHILAEAEG